MMALGRGRATWSVHDELARSSASESCLCGMLLCVGCDVMLDAGRVWRGSRVVWGTAS